MKFILFFFYWIYLSDISLIILHFFRFAQSLWAGVILYLDFYYKQNIIRFYFYLTSKLNPIKREEYSLSLIFLIIYYKYQVSFYLDQTISSVFLFFVFCFVIVFWHWLVIFLFVYSFGQKCLFIHFGIVAKWSWYRVC